MEKLTKIIFQIFAFVAVFFYSNSGELLIMLMGLYFPMMYVSNKVDSYLKSSTL